jgi:hypothetical protein
MDDIDEVGRDKKWTSHKYGCRDTVKGRVDVDVPVITPQDNGT